MVTSEATPIDRVIAAARARGVELEVRTLDQSTRTAAEAAAAVGAEVGQIVKSLVFVGRQPYLALVSGSNLVDVKALAKAVGETEIRRATADEARASTGFVIGGIPPFGHTAPLRTLMDPDLLRYEVVWAAAGTGNSVFPIKPGSLRELAGAEVAAIAQEALPR
jgi:Cys-tRNA(Pro) deacylase